MAGINSQLPQTPRTSPVSGARPMNIVCLGGGWAGLYFAISLKLRNPAHEITVFERNACDADFGWGAVLSDLTLKQQAANDPVSAAAIQSHFVHWEDVAVCLRGERTVSTGHGFSGIAAGRLWQLLQERARQLGVQIRFESAVEDSTVFAQRYDLVVACDGLHSSTRDAWREHFRPHVEFNSCRYSRLGTSQKFDDAFTFIFEQTEQGWVWAHAYQFDAATSVFVVECSQTTWEAFGFGAMSRSESVAVCEQIFSAHLGGHPLIDRADRASGSVWLDFPQIACERWSHQNIVLLGDAAASTHFSIGAGVQLAIEGAVVLADALVEEATVEQALAEYERRHRVAVSRLQSAARNSAVWFEEIDRNANLDPEQFHYSLLTRSQLIRHESLRRRDPRWLRRAEQWFHERAGDRHNSVRTPMFASFPLRGLRLENRVVATSPGQHKAQGGVPGDWHLVHYAEQAKGGAGLVTVEMTAVSPEGRVTPSCTGLYGDEHVAAWKRISEFVHRETDAKFCCQLGHSGSRSSARPEREAMDVPLPDGNRPLLPTFHGARPPRCLRPAEMTGKDMAKVTACFVDAAHRAEEAGFDMLELHCAHGQLLSSFIAPITNQRRDEYGGSLENRLRFPLGVFSAVRATWPAHKPLSVLISADDRAGEEGITPEIALEIAVAFKRAGADVCHVSTGPATMRTRPVSGHVLQTRLAARIRNEGHMPTMAAGDFFEADRVNAVLLSGRADLVCLGRPHLVDPYWTLHAAEGLGEPDGDWAASRPAGRDCLRRLAGQRDERDVNPSDDVSRPQAWGGRYASDGKHLGERVGSTGTGAGL